MRRREFVKTSTVAIAAASMLPKVTFANGRGSDKLKIGLIGCGGRGTGAFGNMVAADRNVELVAVADLYADNMEKGIDKIKKSLAKENLSEIYNVKDDKKFVGFDAYKNLCDCKEIDVVIEATPPIFRTPHVIAVIDAGKHLFMEKPACVDTAQAKDLFEAEEKAKQKGLCVVVGTQRRHDSGYVEALDRIHNGEIGDVVGLHAYWNAGGYVGSGNCERCEKAGLSTDDLEYQIRSWPAFIWTSGDNIVEQHVHNLDVCIWAIGDVLPIEVNGMGSRSTVLPFPKFGDRFTNFAVDYTMPNNIHMISMCRQEPGAASTIMERIVGTKGVAELSQTSQKFLNGDKVVWQKDSAKRASGLIGEHAHLMDCIRNGKKVNEMRRLINSTLVAIAGRMSAYSSKKFKYDFVTMKSNESLMPDLSQKKVAVKAIPNLKNYKLS